MKGNGLTTITALLVILFGLLAIIAPYSHLDGFSATTLLPLGVVLMGVVGLLASRTTRHGPDPE